VAGVRPQAAPAAVSVRGYRLGRVIDDRDPELRVVYEAEHLRWRRPVALTVYAPALAADPAFRSRLNRVAGLLNRLRHPHVARLVDVEVSGVDAMLAVELVAGTRLDRIVGTDQLGPGQVVELLMPVADALEVAHRQMLVHGDLRPDKLVVDARGRAQLHEIGVMDPLAILRQTGRHAGPLDYTSPEQLRGRGATARTDVFGLGAVVFHALTGTPPFPRPRRGDADLLRRLALEGRVGEALPNASERRTGLPQALDPVLQRALADRPGQRQASPRELMRQVSWALGHEQRAPARVGRPERPRPPAATAGAAGHRVAERGPATRPTASPRAPESPRAPDWPRARVPRPPSRTSARDLAAFDEDVALEPPSRDARRRRLGALLAFIAAVLVAAGLGALLGRDTTTPPPAAAPAGPTAVEASRGVVRITHPSTWTALDDPPDVLGLPLRERIALAPPAEPGFARGAAGLLAGTVGDVGTDLLPAGLAGRLTSPPEQETVRLGRLNGYRYAFLAERGTDRQTSLYTVPTQRGVVTLACFAPTQAASSFLLECEAVVARLRLDGARALPLGPSRAFARTLNATLRRFDAQRRGGRQALLAARTLRGQASIAEDLARAAAAAATAQSRAAREPATVRVNRTLVRALGGVRDAYTALAGAARQRDRPAFNVARGLVTQREGALERALGALRAAGYRVR